jgi:hypothetical protein
MPPVSSLQQVTIPDLSLVGIPSGDWKDIPVSQGRYLGDVVKGTASIRNWTPGKKIDIGHRGLRKRLANGQLSVELTPSSIQELINTGLNDIEVDVSADKTGKIWLVHAKDLWEVTRFKGLIAETDVSALSHEDREIVRRKIVKNANTGEIEYSEDFEPTGEYLLSLDGFVKQFMECNPNLEVVGDSRDCDPAPVLAAVSHLPKRIQSRFYTQILNFCGDAVALFNDIGKFGPADGWDEMNLNAILSHNPGALHKQDNLSPETTNVASLLQSSLSWQATYFDLKNSAGEQVLNIVGFDTPVCEAGKYLVADQLVYHPQLGATTDPAIVTMYAQFAANVQIMEHNRRCFPNLFTITPSAQLTYIDPYTGEGYLSQFHKPALTKQTPETDHRHYWFREQGKPGNWDRMGCDGVISDSPLAELNWCV